MARDPTIGLGRWTLGLAAQSSLRRLRKLICAARPNLRGADVRESVGSSAHQRDYARLQRAMARDPTISFGRWMLGLAAQSSLRRLRKLICAARPNLRSADVARAQRRARSAGGT